MKMEFTVERIKILGKGTYGVVHLVKIKTTSGYQVVAMKSANGADDRSVSSLRDENYVLQQFIGSPYIVQCYGRFRSVDPDDHRKTLYSLALEYAWGGSLLDMIKRYGGQIPEEDVKIFVRMILNGLVEIHQKGFIHSDLKPDNILVFYPKVVTTLKIADFGLVKVLGEEDTGIWMYGFRGTAPYMSPESIIGKVSGALDIWSLGCIIVEMITGKYAWDYYDLKDLRDKLLWGETPNIPENMSSLGKDFLMKCFARNPNQRWTATMLLQHPYLQQYQIPPPPGFSSCNSGSCLSSTNPGDNKDKLLGTGSVESSHFPTSSEDDKKKKKLPATADCPKSATYEVMTKTKVKTSFKPPKDLSKDDEDELLSPEPDDEGSLFEELLRSRKIRIRPRDRIITKNRMLAIYC